MPIESEFTKALEDLLNQHSQENGSNTPDFILATYLVACLAAFNEAVAHRERWYGRPFVGVLDQSVPLPDPTSPDVES